MTPETERFMAEWDDLRARYRAATGAEKEALGEQLGAMQDYFDDHSR